MCVPDGVDVYLTVCVPGSGAVYCTVCVPGSGAVYCTVCVPGSGYPTCVQNRWGGRSTFGQCPKVSGFFLGMASLNVSSFCRVPSLRCSSPTGTCPAPVNCGAVLGTHQVTLKSMLLKQQLRRNSIGTYCTGYYCSMSGTW